MTIARVQSTSGSGSGTGLTVAKTLPGAPTAGNLLIAFFNTQGGGESNYVVNTSSWFYIDRTLTNNGDALITAIGRYVQSGDTATMPAFLTSGSTFHSWEVQEISGVSGTWATDFLSSRAISRQLSSNTVVTPDHMALVNGSYAICGYAKYNEGSAGSTPSGWTADINTVNAGNYGSFGICYKAGMNAGDSAQATWVAAGSSSNPQGALSIVLTPSQPTDPYVSRIRHYQLGTAQAPTSTMAFGGDPIVGRLLIGYFHWGDGAGANSDPTFSSNWTKWVSVAGAGSGANCIHGLYRYPQSGDTRNLPAFATASPNNTYSATNILEIGGVSGSWATDHVSDISAYRAASTGSPFSTTAGTSNANNQLGLCSFGEIGGQTTFPSATGGDGAAYDRGPTLYGGQGVAYKALGSSGSSWQTTWTMQAAADKSDYIQSIFGHAPSGAEIRRPFFVAS